MAKRPDIDLDALLLEAMPKPSGYQCLVCSALERLDDSVRDRVRAAINDKSTYTAMGMANVLTALGHKTSRSSMERHRRQGHA